MDIVTRAQWGAQPWDGKVYSVPDTERTEFFVHYHGGPPPAATGVAVARTVEGIHLDNGWAGTGYNFMVDQAGTAFEGRGWGLVGAHCPNHNRSGWGVYVAIGGAQQPTPAALATVRGLYDEGCRRAGFELAKKGHRDGKATACPGDILYAWVRAGMPADVTAPVHAAPVRPIDQPSVRPVLRRGSAGRHVTPVQARLNALGHQAGAADGIFGPATEAAVKRLQTAAGLTVDGIVGPHTYATLDRGVRPAPAAPSVPPFPGTVRRGSRGAAVRAVQQRLADRSWRIDVDGIFGPGTEQVVRAFQADKHLAVDGIAGPATWDALWRAPIT